MLTTFGYSTIVPLAVLFPLTFSCPCLVLASTIEALLAVTIDQIRLPIKVQNRRNKQTYDTYACTINIFPHVLAT